MRLPLEQVFQAYQLSVYRAAFYICKNQSDAEDVTQDTFLAYFKSSQQFDSEEHLRRWLLRVAINKAKNLAHSFWRRNRNDLEDCADRFTFEIPEDSEMLEAVLALPERCRVIVHLFYYEDYSVREIAELLGIRENTVKSQLHRGRTLLKEKLQEGWNDDEP